MKRFILHIVTVLLIAATILLGFTWYTASSIKRVDYTLPDTVHIIAIGPSTTGCALTEQSLHGFRNISRNGTSLPYLIPWLPRLLDDNQQIDTVLINFGRFHVFMGSDPKNQSLQSIRDLMCFMYYDFEATDWDALARNPNFYGALLNPNFFERALVLKARHLTDFGFRYNRLERNYLHKVDAEGGILSYEKQKAEHGGNIYTKEWITKNRFEKDYWARRAVAICRERNVVPIFFFTPLYQYDRWVEPQAFYEYMSTFDDDILIADYEDFQFPDDSYYGDVHHLNYHGAEYFTSHLARNGSEAKPLRQWLHDKGFK